VLRELLDQPGVVEQVELRGRFGFMAFHGGSLERMTDAIAVDAAARAGASCYVVAQPEDLRWHVPSKLFDPADSPRLARFLDHVDDVVAVHGFGRAGMFTTLLLGGTGRGLAEDLGARLRPALPDYGVAVDLDEIPAELRGLHPGNPVNRVRGDGVQLELPPRVRGLGPHWLGRDDPGAHRRLLVDALVETARDRRRAADPLR
jgi:phage replication-related protein YjqB (UPF0714/DUF867 family)